VPNPLADHMGLHKFLLHGMLGRSSRGVNSSNRGKDLLRDEIPRGRAIMTIRLHPYRGNPVISSKPGESCAIVGL
jgi:hypothetical protein